MAVALEQFVKQLADSGVIAPGKLENFVPPKASPKDAQELARQLVHSKQLTAFQAQEIYQGRAKSLILGNYTILDKIGEGGMGQVFKAEHRRKKRIVAVKMLPRGVTKDPAAVARFQREVEAAAKLRHPNIVAADDADEANGVHFLVMEYVEGSDLSAVVKAHGPLPVAKAVNYVLQAARGLEFAHGEGVVHRDIKPANLLLDKKGTVKILDMGLARLSSDGNAATQADLTGTGAVLGTVDYMAPEQALSTKHADARADIYSLGCTLYYLLAGKPAYDGDTLMARLLAHRETPIPSLGADVPEQVQAIFEKMVAKTVEDRYQTMSQVVAALEPCSSGSQTSLSMQQSVNTNLDAGGLTFLRDVPVRTTHQPKPTKKAVPAEAGKGHKKFILGAVGAAVLGLAILAAVIIKMRSKDGTLVVEVDQPDAVVQVLDAAGKVEIRQPGGKGPISISVDAGKHRLKVEKDGFQFFAQDFTMASGGKQSIKAVLQPIFENATLNDPAFQQWMKEAAALPAEKQVEAVVKKLQELNPGFDGSETHKIEGGVVKELCFAADNVGDIAPLRVLAGLNTLICDGSEPGTGRLSDLSPLAGMPLTELRCDHTAVSDLTPVKEMNLTVLRFTPKKITAGIEAIRQMKSLKTIGCWERDLFSPAEFWKKFDAGEFGKPLTNINDPAFQQWMKEVAALPAEHQLEAVAKKLRELNPGFDGKLTAGNQLGTPRIEKGVVVELGIIGANVTDISPLRALGGLRNLCCATGKLSDLSPLKGMKLDVLAFGQTPVSDLSPLEGMSLWELRCSKTRVSDLSPLKRNYVGNLDIGSTLVSDLSPLVGMRLKSLAISSTPVSDLSPLKGMSFLKELQCDDTPISDLSPLEGMKLTTIAFTPKNITKGLDAIRHMKSLKTLGTRWDRQGSPEAFWKKFDAGEYNKADSKVIVPKRKPNATRNDPAVKQWMKEGAPPPAVAPFDAKKAQEHQAAWAKYLGVPVEVTNAIGMKLVLIPPGEFDIGSPQEPIDEKLKTAPKDDKAYLERLPSEGPRHDVRITRPFYLGMYLVTQEEYQRVMGTNPSDFSATGYQKDIVAGQDTKRFPVEMVTWQDANEFCARLSEMPEEKSAGRRYRLPSEAQWEYACRAGSTGRCFFSPASDEKKAAENLLPDYAWFKDNAGGRPHAVGGRRASAWGLYDIYGNVWEWCQDWYAKDYYAKSPADDPAGPAVGSNRVFRGGSWRDPARNCRSAYRNDQRPGIHYDAVGFRVSLVLAEE